MESQKGAPTESPTESISSVSAVKTTVSRFVVSRSNLEQEEQHVEEEVSVVQSLSRRPSVEDELPVPLEPRIIIRSLSEIEESRSARRSSVTSTLTWHATEIIDMEEPGSPKRSLSTRFRIILLSFINVIMCPIYCLQWVWHRVQNRQTIVFQQDE